MLNAHCFSCTYRKKSILSASHPRLHSQQWCCITLDDGTLLFGSSTANCFVLFCFVLFCFVLFCLFVWDGAVMGVLWQAKHLMLVVASPSFPAGWLAVWLTAPGWTFVECWFGACREFVRGFCLFALASSFMTVAAVSIHWRRRRRLIRFIAIIPFCPRIYRRIQSNPPSTYTLKEKRRRRQIRNSIDKRIER